MSTSMRTYTFSAPGSGSDLNELNSIYPWKQTQALILAIEETRDWALRSRKMFGDHPPECLKERSDWVKRVELSLEGLEDAIEEEDDLEPCRLCADDAWYDAISELCDACPDDRGSDGALHEAVERMSLFWITNVRHHLQTTISLMSGDGEVRAILEKYTPPTKK